MPQPLSPLTDRPARSASASWVPAWKSEMKAVKMKVWIIKQRSLLFVIHLSNVKVISWLLWGNQGFQARLLPLGLMFLVWRSTPGRGAISFSQLHASRYQHNHMFASPACSGSKRKDFKNARQANSFAWFKIPCKGMLEMLSIRVTANPLPVEGTSSKQSLAAASQLPS